MSVTTLIFHEKPNELFVAVGTAQNMQLTPRKVPAGFIHIYRVVQNQDQSCKLEFVHKVKTFIIS